jgi:hypothetical protein
LLLAQPIGYRGPNSLPRSKTFEGSRQTSRVGARASVGLAVSVLWLFIEAAGDTGLCGESNTRAQSFVAPTEMERKIAWPNATRDKSLLVPRVVDTTLVEQKQILKWGREKSDILADRLKPIQQLDAAQGKAAQALQCAPAWERKQALEHEQECDSAEVLARALTSSLREELDALRSATEAARIKQKQALDQARDRADALARELTSLWAERDAARIAGSEAVQAAEAERQQKQALEQARDRADALARELTSVRAELDAARIAGSEAVQAAKAERPQEQALEQERNRADVLERELTSLRAELDTARAAALQAVRTAEAAKIEQSGALGKERDKSETLARELASARKGVEERSARLAAAHAEVLQVTETNRAAAEQQKLALAGERERADTLARELASVRNELEAGSRQIAALNVPRALNSCESAADRRQQRITDASGGVIEGARRPPELISDHAVASSSERSSASGSPRQEVQATVGEAASDPDQKVAMETKRSGSTGVASRSPVDEQRLLARANALLGQADISGARLLLEHALEHGSARAAFILAETYGARVLQSWRARGTSGDLEKARELYERAKAGGIEGANERIKTLK